MDINLYKKLFFKILKITSVLLIWLTIWNNMNLETGKRLFVYLGVIDANRCIKLLQSFYLLGFLGVLVLIGYIITKNISFLKVDNKKIFLFYLFPFFILLTIVSFFRGNISIGDNLIDKFSLVVISISQDILTFGLLETYLEGIISCKNAAVITVIMFFIGHIGFFPINFLLLFYVFGFVLFGYLRYRYKNIYLVNIIHTSFNILRGVIF